MKRCAERGIQLFVPFLMMLAISFQTKNIARSGAEEIFYVYAFFTSVFIGTCWILSVDNVVNKDRISKFLYILGSAFGAVAGMAIHDFIL